MFVAQRNPHDEPRALAFRIVDYLDSAVVKLDKRISQVQTYSGASRSIVSGLIETLKYMFLLFIGHAHTVVGHSYLGIVPERSVDRHVGSFRQAYVDFSAVGGIFYGVRQKIHHYLVEIGVVNPRLQVVASLVVECKLHATHRRRVMEQVVEVGDERSQKSLRKRQLHLVLVNLADIHQLVHQTHHPLGVALYKAVVFLAS